MDTGGTQGDSSPVYLFPQGIKSGDTPYYDRALKNQEEYVDALDYPVIPPL